MQRVGAAKVRDRLLGSIETTTGLVSLLPSVTAPPLSLINI